MTTAANTSRPRAFDPRMASEQTPPTRPPGWDLGTERRIDNGEMLANAIAWFAIGLGAAELLAPGRIAQTLGIRGRNDLIRLYGVREITKSVGILSKRQPVAWMWARVAGDALDLVSLASALPGAKRHRNRIAVAMAAVAGVAALDVVCARQLTSARRPRIRPSQDVRPPLAERGVR